MKKLLFLLSFLIAYQIGQSQALITLKGGQFGIGSLLPIPAKTIVANPTAGNAVPQAVQLGFALFFDGTNKLALDTSKLRDTIFAVNGLQMIGDIKHIGIGGFLSQNTNLSGSNLYSLTLDSMQAAIGRGFRVNFKNDAGWDLIVRDSATGFWTRIPKGSPGQKLTMLPGGGIGWQ